MGLVQLKVEFKVFFKPIKKIWNNFFFMLFSTNKKKLKNYRISFNFENVWRCSAYKKGGAYFKLICHYLFLNDK